MQHILLIRHAECVMNLHLATTIGGRANDSPLTRRGRAQAAALGERLAKLPPSQRPSLLFASSAVRARETAEAISRALAKEESRGGGEARRLPVQLREELLEIEMGRWAGADRKGTYTPEVLARIRASPLDFAAPGGESQRQVEERVARCVEERVLPAAAAAAAEAAERTSSSGGGGGSGSGGGGGGGGGSESSKTLPVVAVVAHGVSIKTLLRRVLASDPARFAAARNISLANTGICEIALDTTRKKSHNDGDPSKNGPLSDSASAAEAAVDREKWHLIRINDAAHLEGLADVFEEEEEEEEQEREEEASSPRLDA